MFEEVSDAQIVIPPRRAQRRRCDWKAGWDIKGYFSIDSRCECWFSHQYVCNYYTHICQPVLFSLILGCAVSLWLVTSMAIICITCQWWLINIAIIWRNPFRDFVFCVVICSYQECSCYQWKYQYSVVCPVEATVWVHLAVLFLGRCLCSW